jgi:hypothetical protein
LHGLDVGLRPPLNKTRGPQRAKLEETIYVTVSRQPVDVDRRLAYELLTVAHGQAVSVNVCSILFSAL